MTIPHLNYFDDEYQGQWDGDQDEETGAQDDDQRYDTWNLNSKLLAIGERSYMYKPHRHNSGCMLSPSFPY